MSTEPHEHEGTVKTMRDRERLRFSLVRRFSTGFWQTRPMVSFSHPRFVTLRQSLGYAGARFRARFTRLWQNTAMPSAAAKLLNPRYMQIESRNARFKTEIDPSIPALK